MKRINEKNYKIYIAIIVAVICSMVFEKINAQSWTNSTTITNGASKIEPTSIANYNLEISIIDNKFYIPKNPFINGYYTYNTNFSNIDNIGFPESGAYMGKFLYKTNDTTYYNQGLNSLNKYGKLDITNNTLVKKINDSLPNIQLGDKQIWTGKYIFSLDLTTTFNKNIKVSEVNNNTTTELATLALPTTYNPTNIDIKTLSGSNYKLQVLNENSIIFTYFQEETELNEYTLFTKKYVYHSNDSISEENITEINDFKINTFNVNNIFTICDITYTNSLDTMVMAINNNSGSSKQLPSVFNTTIQNGKQGYYVFKNNTPSSTKNIKTNSVLVYPNPSVDGNVYFGSNDTETKLIYDLSGREIQSTRDNKIHLERGIYIIKINGVNNKVIIQ
jgi:hypothetical protein